ncbi:MAG TPA: CvpA family protein [Rhizomicrobium sp.]|jgi:membrane protein required for colicin V production
MNLPVTVLDCLIVLVIIVSAGYAAWRGFLWETLTVFAWIAAAFGCLYFGPYMIPLTRSLVSEAWLASVIAYAAVFLAVFIPFAFMSHRFSEAVKHSPIGPLDRAAGVAFGVVRGLVIVGLAYLAFTYFVPIREHPHWLTEARLLPVVQSTSEVLLTVVPDHSRDYIDRALPAVVRQAPPQTQPEAEKPRAASYDPMADLIRSNGKTRDVRQKSAAQIPSKTTKSYGVSERQALDRLVETGGSGKP